MGILGISKMPVKKCLDSFCVDFQGLRQNEPIEQGRVPKIFLDRAIQCPFNAKGLGKLAAQGRFETIQALCEDAKRRHLQPFFLVSRHCHSKLRCISQKHYQAVNWHRSCLLFILPNKTLLLLP